MNTRRSLSFVLCFIFSIILSACDQKTPKLNSLKFNLYYQNQVLTCESLKASAIKLNELRFYIHDVRANNLPLQLIENDDQYQSLAYLDFSATLRHCDSKNDLQPNEEVLFLSDSSEIGNLSFKLGVPLSLNHQNPVKAKSPLNRSDMHWQWLSGYKFLRLEYVKNNELNRFHLGSIGCSGKLPDDVKCQQVNRLSVNLKEFNSENSNIEVHIDDFLKAQESSLCMGNASDDNCKVWFKALEGSVFKVGLR